VEDSRINQPDGFLDPLLRLVAALRGKNGCPWDKEQTPRSVSVYLKEEVFELAEAIDNGDPGEIQEELGDVLFHIVFIARMFKEAGRFGLQDVVEGITQKMIRRHPHVFEDRTINDSEEVSENWHKIKLKEKKSSQNTSIFDSVPATLPSLMRAYRISDRAAKSGFEWLDMASESHNPDGWPQRLKDALRQPDKDLQSQEFGHLLFALVNLCRRADIHPEIALAGTLKEFERQVKKMQDSVADSAQELEGLSLERKAEIWKKINHS
jgi:tetrapyrrole methylase family protein/MazG family protein